MTASDVVSLRPQRIGVIGAGKVGMTVARAAVEAGYEVAIAGSGDADRVALTAQFLAPGARPMTTAEAAEFAEVVVLALPMHRFRQLDRGLLAGKIVIDPMNHWEPVDGSDADFVAAGGDTSSLVQDWFAGSQVVKSLNQLAYYDLDGRRRPPGDPERVAQAVASDHPHAARVVADLLDRLGFDAVDAGPLAAGISMAPGSEACGAAYDAATLGELLQGCARRRSTPRRSDGSTLAGSGGRAGCSPGPAQTAQASRSCASTRPIGTLTSRTTRITR